MLIVPTLVGVHDKTVQIRVRVEGGSEHVSDHLKIRASGYSISDDLPIIHVKYWGEIHFFVMYAYLSDVGCPFLVGSVRGKIPVDNVRCDFAYLTLIRAIASLLNLRFYPHLAHQFLDRLMVDHQAFVTQIIAYASVPVTAVAIVVQFLDPPPCLVVSVADTQTFEMIVEH